MAEKKDDNKTLKTDFHKLISDIFDVSGQKGYKKFLFFLILIDMTWFASVVADNLLGLSLGDYGEFAWVFLFGAGLLIMSNAKRVVRIRKTGFKSDNFANLATFIIGILALVTAFLSLPQFNITSPVLSAIKGILALIAIIYVILEAWVIRG
jgi:hypothetical protein